MALIPGNLPAGTCYGSPQQLMDLFAQYLSAPATTQAILYSATAPNVSDEAAPIPAIFVDNSVAGSPVVKFYGGAWKEVGVQTVKKTVTSANVTSGAGEVSLLTLPARSLLLRVVYYFTSGFTSGTMSVGMDAPNYNDGVNGVSATSTSSVHVTTALSDANQPANYSSTTVVKAKFSNASPAAGSVEIWLSYLVLP